MPRQADVPLLALGALALALALPSDVFSEGLGFLGWLVLVPVYSFTFRHGTRASGLAGLFFAALTYLFSTPWLGSFHPLAFPLVLVLMAPLYAACFAVSAWLWRVFPHRGVWAQASLWTVFEWGRNLGWLAFPYGSLASTQAFVPLSFQSADLLGTSALTFVMALTAALAARSLLGSRPYPKGEMPAVLLLVGLNFGYGAFKLAEPAPNRLWRPALIQPAQDPWKGGPSVWAESVGVLAQLSRGALAKNPDAVIWPETAVVPSVFWHTRYRTDAVIWPVIRQLETFLDTVPVPVVLGNDHGVLAGDGVNRVDYNAALLWDSGWKSMTFKNRLVPFTESFPPREAFPDVEKWLEASGSRFWEPGTSQVVFDLHGLPTGQLICFEDAFGGAGRNLALQGARVLINLTNDAWSAGTAARNQHVALAVFRSVETRLPLVRAANDGRTAAVSDRGVVTAWLPVGPAGFLVPNVAIADGPPTLYTVAGDVFPWVLALFGGLWAAWSFIRIRLTRVSSYRKIMPLE